MIQIIAGLWAHLTFTVIPNPLSDGEHKYLNLILSFRRLTFSGSIWQQQKNMKGRTNSLLWAITFERNQSLPFSGSWCVLCGYHMYAMWLWREHWVLAGPRLQNIGKNSMCLVSILNLLGFLWCVQAHHSLVHILFSQDYQVPPSSRASSNLFSWQQDQNFCKQVYLGPSLNEACKDGNEIFRIHVHS